MESTVNKLLHISYHCMNQRKPFRYLSWGSYFLFVKMVFSYSIECGESICSNILSGFQVECKKIMNIFFRNCINSLHSYKTSTLDASFHSDKNRPFSFCPTTPLTSTLYTNISVIKFNQVLKSIDTVSMSHCRTDLSKHITCSRPGHPHVFGQSKVRDASFVRSSEINWPNPFYKWCFLRMKQCIGSYRHLVSTLGALVKFSCINETGFFISTCWTLKALWPGDFGQCSIFADSWVFLTTLLCGSNINSSLLWKRNLVGR